MAEWIRRLTSDQGCVSSSHRSGGSLLHNAKSVFKIYFIQISHLLLYLFATFYSITLYVNKCTPRHFSGDCPIVEMF